MKWNPALKSSVEELISDLQVAAQTALGAGSVQVLKTHPDHVVVRWGRQTYDFPYTIDTTGRPQLGSPIQVQGFDMYAKFRSFEKSAFGRFDDRDRRQRQLTELRRFCMQQGLHVVDEAAASLERTRQLRSYNAAMQKAAEDRRPSTLNLMWEQLRVVR
jgi:hypothetical protein